MGRLRDWIWVASTFFSISCFWNHPAWAQTGSEPPVAPTDQPLATFSPSEIDALAPLLRTGTVSLVGFAHEGEIPAVAIATVVDAPIDVVARVIGDPRHYPAFMPALDEVTVESETENQLAYRWAWRTSIFTLRGSNTMQHFAPPPEHPEMGHRFVVRSIGGDLGAGRTVWRVLPRGERQSLVMTSSRMDLRDANYIARQLAAAGTSMNRTVTIAINFAMLLRTRMEAERLAGHRRVLVTPPSGEPARPDVNAMTLESLLTRGDVMWVETSGDDLGAIAIFGAMHTPEATTRAAMLDPQGFTQGLVAGSHATVLERGPNGTRFEWGIDLPLVGTSGQMLLGETNGGRVHLDGIEGALASARWRFETIARPYGTLVVTWGRFDPGEGIWLLRVVAEADGAFKPGLGSATQLMMMRGLRTRLIRGI
jgi:hypothetical protein